jgi:hypothetical protein
MLRIGSLRLGAAALQTSGWQQVPGYFLTMLSLPELLVVRNLRFDRPKWLMAASVLLAITSFAWAALLVWVANRLGSEDDISRT